MASRLLGFLAELRRRKVYHVAVAYAVVSAIVAGAANDFLPRLSAPDWAVGFILFLLLIGFPIALVLAWAYEVRPEEPGSLGPSENAALRFPQSAAPIPTSNVGQRKSIVVLPFDSMSPDPGDAYFADGLTEEITSGLSHLRSLRVISRNSALVFKSTPKDVRAIGRELDVQYVLEGSVRKAGNDLRITAQLIDAISDEHLWTEKYDGVLEDVFVMQEDVSRSIVDALQLTLRPEEDRQLAERPIEDVRVLDCYLKARSDMMAGGGEHLQRALHNLKMGAEVLGESDILYQGMAEVHLLSYEYGVKQDEETLQHAEEFANLMASLRPDSPHSHYLRGRIERFRSNSSGAAVHWERALALDPNHLNSLVWLVAAYSIQAGRPSLADALVHRLSEIDPLTPLTVFVMGMYHWMAGRLEAATSAFDKAVALDTSGIFLHPHAAYALVWQDKREDAVDLLDRIIERNAVPFLVDWAAFLKHALQGDKASAMAALSDELRNYCWFDPEAQWLATSTFSVLGEKDEARRWLHHCLDCGWINYPVFSSQDPLLENVREEEWFKDMMSGVKTDWDAFGAERGVDA